jgi:hypothetical protein
MRGGVEVYLITVSGRGVGRVGVRVRIRLDPGRIENKPEWDSERLWCKGSDLLQRLSHIRVALPEGARQPITARALGHSSGGCT